MAFVRCVLVLGLGASLAHALQQPAPSRVARSTRLWAVSSPPPRRRSTGLSDQMKEARASMEEDERMSMLMQSLRGSNLNDDDQAAIGMEMTLVEVVKGDDELPMSYDPAELKRYFSKRPSAVVQRSLQVGAAASGFLAKLAADKAMKRSGPEIQVQRASELRDLVTRLGPFFIKIGQALSIRPDILPPKSMVELQKLCDKVPSFDSKIAMATMREELGRDPMEIFSELTAEPIAAASLGQVYKGRLRSTGELVAVKVQRPFVLETVSLDLHLMREAGLALGRLPMFQGRTDFVGLVDEFAGRFYDELDYNLECENGLRIAKHMAHLPRVRIPKNYPEYTTRRVHVAEWIDGEKLAQSTADDVGELVNLGVVTYLTQLLGEGFFHADPHPGNMIRTPDGELCILDFGLMTEVTDDQKFGMIEAIVHLINRDYADIGDDFKNLDFIPREVDVKPIIPALTNVFDAALAGGGAKSINFNDLAADLAQITFEYPFRIPPYFALVIRAIGVLEGIALVGNPDFAIVDEAYPYISQRLLTDQHPRLRAALRYMVYGRDGVFDAERLLDLLAAFEDFDFVRKSGGYVGPEGAMAPGMAFQGEDAARVSAALELFFSPDGAFFREFLMEETVRSVDVLSRNALFRLTQGLPAALAPLRRFSPLETVLPPLSPEEETTLRSTRALLSFFLDRGATAAEADVTPAQRVQGVLPVFRTYAGAMRDFGLQVSQRLAEVAATRAVDATLDAVLGPKSVPPTKA